MRTFKSLNYSIHLELKMKRDVTNAFCCLSFTITKGLLKSATVRDQTCPSVADSGGVHSEHLL